MRIAGGELWFEHPQEFVMNVALDKTIQEFKMWSSMSRKPGQPAEYMKHLYDSVLIEHRAVPGGTEKYPEVGSDRVWESLIKKLFQKDYKFDAGFFGSLNEFSRKVAYFFHASLQGTACYDGAAAALKQVAKKGVKQGLLADGQCFTRVQLQRSLAAQERDCLLDKLLDKDLICLSYEIRGRKPSERLFRQAVNALNQQGLTPNQVLHVGTSIPREPGAGSPPGNAHRPVRFDRTSLQATPEQIKEPIQPPRRDDYGVKPGRRGDRLIFVSGIAKSRRQNQARNGPCRRNCTLILPNWIATARWPDARTLSASIRSDSRWCN